MSIASSISGTIDEAVVFRQGVSVVTMAHQLQGMLPKMSAGTRARLVVSGNAPDSDVYFDDSKMGLGPGTITPDVAQIHPVYFFVDDEDKFIEQYDLEDQGIFKLTVTGTYDGAEDATYRIQIADPDDDDVYTLGQPTFNAILAVGETSIDHLDDLSVLLEDHTETSDTGEETVLIASSSYDASQGITTYKIEIASADDGSADRVIWYKNNELVSSSADGEVINTDSGNVLEDGNNRIAVRFDYDGYEDYYHGTEQKHSAGDSWTIIAGAQQFKWRKGQFDDSSGLTFEPPEGSLIASGSGPVGILPTSMGLQHLHEGIYIQLPSQLGYSDGSDPNIEQSIWEFGVTSKKVEQAITAMQEALGKIEVLPDHRAEQRDFGQPKFHKDFDIATVEQQQIAAIELKVASEIGTVPYIGTDRQLYMSIDGKKINYSGADVGFVPDDLDALTMSTDLYGFKLWAAADGSIGTLVDIDESLGITIDSTKAEILEILNDAGHVDEQAWADSIPLTPAPLVEAAWVLRYGFLPAIGKKSYDGKVGPYFTIYDLHPKCKTYRNNHVWYNFGNTTTLDLTRYDDRDPKPQLSDPCMVDISGRELVDITMGDSMTETVDALYEVYNVDVLHELDSEDAKRTNATLGTVAEADPFGAGPDGWTNDAGETLRSAAGVGFAADYDSDGSGTNDKMGQDSSGTEFWTKDGGVTLTSSVIVGWDPDTWSNDGGVTFATYATSHDVVGDLLVGFVAYMSVDVAGNVILDGTTGVDSPKIEADWMDHHGYERWYLDENEWMTREGYTAMEDLLHGKHFTLYDYEFAGFFVWFDVDDRELPPSAFQPSGAYTAYLDTGRPTIDESVYTHDPDETDDDTVTINKSRSQFQEIRLRLSRSDKAKDIAAKLIERINREIPTAWLSPYHHFCIGVDTRDMYKAIPDDNDDTVVQIELRQSGRVFEPDFGNASLNNETPEGFQAYLRTYGGLAYNDYVVDDSITSEGVVIDAGSAKKVIRVGKFIKLFNSTAYYYLLPGTSHPDWVDEDHKWWSRDDGVTLVQFVPVNPPEFPMPEVDDTCVCEDGVWVTEAGTPIDEPDWTTISESEWAELGGYLPYALIDAYKPHIIWFNVDGISKNPGAIATDGTNRYADLWSYDVGDSDAADLIDGHDNGRILEVRLSRRAIDRNVAHQIKTAINLSTQFQIPFMASTPGNQEYIRIQQRDPGPILNLEDDQIDSVDICNAPATYEVQLAGTPAMSLDRDFVADSMLFSFEDSSVIAQRFNASKRVIEHYATYDINCVAEQKDGYLFDYSTVEEWTDDEGFSHPGGKVEKSNYEWGDELVGIPQAVNSAGEKLWTTEYASDVRKTATQAGYLPNIDTGSGAFDKMTIDADGRKIWIKNDPADDGEPLAGALPLTAHSIGRSDSEMEDETVAGIPDYIEHSVDEDEWMALEEYSSVPAFSHVVSNAAYVFLPHPELNYYIWFDVADLSADPGDDGKLDDVTGEADYTTDPITYANRQKIGGAIRVPVASYDNAGTVAEKLVERINGTCYDVGKKYVTVGKYDSTDDGIPDTYTYQAIVAGNINHHFYAEISSEDSSVVRIYSRQPGLVSHIVLDENENIAPTIFPVTASGDEMTFTVIDDGDPEYFVDIESIVPGTIYPPEMDVGKPDVDTGLSAEVSEEPYTPTQPGVTKVLAKFIPYEDMMSIDRGYREIQEDGTEIAKDGPVAYIQDDIGTLMYPIIMANVSMKDPDQYDGAIEPLEIRSRASRNSPDGYFVAHEVKGMVMTNMAEDSRKRSNPISQFIEPTYMIKDEFRPGEMVIGNRFDPYEDGIEHMASSPAAASFTRTPVFGGVGTNDMTVTGSYIGTTGASAVFYYIKVSDVGTQVDDIIYFDKMKWKKDDENWSDAIELDDTGYVEKEVILTFGNLGGLQAIPSLSTANPSGPDALYSSTQELLIPDSALSMDLAIHCRGDINQQNEYYRIEWYDEVESEWRAIADYSNVETVTEGGDEVTSDDGRGYSPNIEGGTLINSYANTWEDYTRFNDPYHPTYNTDSRTGYNTTPHGVKGWNGTTDLDPNGGYYTSDRYTDYTKMKFRIMASAFVDSDSPYKNSVKLIFTFKTRAAQLELDQGLTAVFENSFGHTAGDTWYFEAIAKSHEDNVGSAVLPGYLTWQEAKISPFTESAEKEAEIINLNDPVRTEYIATGSLVFNFISAALADEESYIGSLNAQAFTLVDSFGTSSRFEFDNDGELENDGEMLVPLLRPESYYLRFPATDAIIHRRASNGRLLWTDGVESDPFTSGGMKEDGVTPHTAFTGETPTYVAYNSTEDGTEADWVTEYKFTAVYATTEEMSLGLETVSDYAGKYFIITNQLEKPYQAEEEAERAGILNTVIGRRYAVWFNVVSLDADGKETSVVGSDEPSTGVTDQGRWTTDYGLTLKDPGLPTTVENGYGTDYTGYVPDYDSDGDGIFDKMVTTLSYIIPDDPGTIENEYRIVGGDKLWTYDGVTVTTAVVAGYTGFFDELVDDASTTCVEGDTVVSTWTEEEWAAANGYYEMPLSEKEWHESAMACTLTEASEAYGPTDELQQPYSDYIDMVPQLIEVKVRDTDSILRMIRKLVRTLRQHRNTNQSKTFSVKYAKPPEYEDLWDLFDTDEDGVPDDGYPAGFTPDDGAIWKVADYDPERLVKIDTTWFNTYAVDPTSPPNVAAAEAGWQPGYHTIRIESLNPGYHIVRDYEAAGVPPAQGWEPGFQNIDPAPPNEVRDFQLTQGIEDPGGYKSFHTLLSDTCDIVNNSILDITSSLRYNTPLGTSDPALFNHIFVTGKTLLDTSSYDFIDGRAGLLLYQNTPGPEGNTLIQFHHYNDDIAGNVIAQNFHSGYNAGPYVSDAIVAMNMSTENIKPNRHKSSTSGLVFENNPDGTDSVAFGGWKK